MQINVANLAFWMVVRILSEAEILDRVREEIKDFIDIDPSTERLQIASDSLVGSCTLLKACYLETLRLHHEPWSVRKLKKDLLVSGDVAKTHVLKAGQYINIPHALHHMDKEHFLEPHRFNPGRFLVRRDDGSSTVQLGTLSPFGGGVSKCKGMLLAETECLSFVAGLLVVWDIAPTENDWQLPAKQSSTGVSLPAQDIRVRLQRRERTR
jgi:cytochrome P450